MAHCAMQYPKSIEAKLSRKFKFLLWFIWQVFLIGLLKNIPLQLGIVIFVSNIYLSFRISMKLKQNFFNQRGKF